MSTTTLYNDVTNEPTARLALLREGGFQPIRTDIMGLFEEYKFGCRLAGEPGSMVDFGAWLVGNQYDEVKDWYSSNEPAESTY